MSLRLIPVLKGDLCPSRLLSLITEFSVCAPSGHSTKEQLIKGRFFEGLLNYMENKCQGNENKILLGDSISTMDKMDRDGGNKTQRFYDIVHKIQDIQGLH